LIPKIQGTSCFVDVVKPPGCDDSPGITGAEWDGDELVCRILLISSSPMKR
jgi:hypothetical protein